jgi:hypothetical protein
VLTVGGQRYKPEMPAGLREPVVGRQHKNQSIHKGWGLLLRQFSPLCFNIVYYYKILRLITSFLPPFIINKPASQLWCGLIHLFILW